MTIKILAVDDSQTMRQALEISFGGEDADITTLERGKDVVARAKEIGPDVILVDARLGAGDLSGAQVCGAIRAEPSLAQTPIVWMMPDREGTNDEKAKNVGATVAVGKPFDSQHLITTVFSVCKVQASPKRVQSSAAAGVAKVAASGGASRAVHPPSFSGSKTPPRPKVSPPSRPATASPAASSDAVSIPVAVPIPFTSAASPTPGMLARIEKAMQSGAAQDASGVSAETMKALASLSHEIVERIAWEVVPELAESILRERSASGR